MPDPKGMETSITVPVFKKSMKYKSCKLQRHNAIKFCSKLLTKILTKKVTDKISLRRARIQAEQINSIYNFILRQLIEKSVKFNKLMFVFFMEQAFDRIRLVK